MQHYMEKKHHPRIQLVSIIYITIHTNLSFLLQECCSLSSLPYGAPLLLAESSLQADFDLEVVNIPPFSSLKPYFTLKAWMTLLQKGITHHVTKYACMVLKCTVSGVKEEWKCHNCTHVTTRENMIACDAFTDGFTGKTIVRESET